MREKDKGSTKVLVYQFTCANVQRACISSSTLGYDSGVVLRLSFGKGRDVAAAPQTPQLGGAQANFGGPS